MTFDAKKTVKYWLDSAEYDLETGRSLLESMLDKLAEYMEFHLESRYPDEKRDFYKKCNEEFTGQKFTEMEEVY